MWCHILDVLRLILIEGEVLRPAGFWREIDALQVHHSQPAIVLGMEVKKRGFGIAKRATVSWTA
jgi:hypothetical protein